ncbi:MAG: hypothetical protein BWY05_01362 [Euryarchaeota archaeon ADurb.Bin165]|nr:MAG: hypothetical protein BWY05_01362 [Euryarchaeota archaeon ADurb.Bin165]
MNHSAMIASGTANITPHRLPRAEIRTASSPFPSRVREWAGRTDRAVPSSGTPRNVAGIISRKEWVMSVAIRTAAIPSGPSTGSNAGEKPRRRAAIMFEWMPGASPLIIPHIVPPIMPAKTGIIWFSCI